MRFHSQNLHNRHGSIWTSGRCWWHLTSVLVLRAEWNLWSKRTVVSLDIATSDDTVVMVSLSPFLFSLWLAVDYYPLHRWIQDRIKPSKETYGNGREIELAWFEGSLRIVLWGDPMSWRAKDPWWIRGVHVNPTDLILGRTTYTESTLSVHAVEIPMPEGVYPGTVRLLEATWRRPRWPFQRLILRAEIVPATPIPFPGKGENSWDCGEDATHSLICEAASDWEAVGALVTSVLRSRYRYGGHTWRPAEKVST